MSASNECVHTESGEIKHVIPVKASPEKIEEFLGKFDNWGIEEDGKLAKTIRLPSFEDAIIYVNRIAALASEYNHHPEIYIWKKEVKLVFWTRKLPGLSEKDLDMAKLCEHAAKSCLSAEE